MADSCTACCKSCARAKDCRKASDEAADGGDAPGESTFVFKTYADDFTPIHLRLQEALLPAAAEAERAADRLRGTGFRVDRSEAAEQAAPSPSPEEDDGGDSGVGGGGEARGRGELDFLDTFIKGFGAHEEEEKDDDEHVDAGWLASLYGLPSFSEEGWPSGTGKSGSPECPSRSPPPSTAPTPPPRWSRPPTRSWPT